MSLKDRFDKFIEYFTEDGDDVQVAESRVQQQAVKPSNSRPAQQEPVRDIKQPRLVSNAAQHVTNTPYEDAPAIVDLLLANESVLIDFQYMTEVQARRCIDYLDGAKQVLMGNLRRVSGTMYLLTPVNVVVNIEDIKLPDGVHSEFDFDMKRR